MSKLLNISEFIAFFVGASANLTANKEQINALNVFPVPDGDTGTNMGLTMSSAVKELPEQTDIPKAAERLAHGALLGARGNSGVILSQILRQTICAQTIIFVISVCSQENFWREQNFFGVVLTEVRIMI